MGRIILGMLLVSSLMYGREWTLRIEGMHCISCTLAVKKALSGVKGVTNAKVNFKTQTAVVTADDTVTLRMMQDAVQKTGYTANALIRH